MTKNFKLLLEEASALGLSTNIIYPEKEVVEISDDQNKILVKEVFAFAENSLSASAVLAKNKEVTYRLWERVGVPFPRNRYFKNKKFFSRDAEDMDLLFPVVFKKSNGKKSLGIRTNINSFGELERIVAEADHGFIIQEMVFGKEYRLLLHGGRLLGALELVPPQIIGNGVDTINALIQRKNVDLQTKILINEKVLETIKKNGFLLTSVLADGSCVALQENSCLAEGGSSIDCTDIVHPDILGLAHLAAQSINLKLAGIDLICEDISADPNKQKISFLEANSFPSLSIHYEPTFGQPRRVIKDILTEIFKKQ